MKLFNNTVETFPVCRLVFDDQQEYIEFELLALQLGMGKEWPISMLRDYLASYKECAAVGSRPGPLGVAS